MRGDHTTPSQPPDHRRRDAVFEGFVEGDQLRRSPAAPEFLSGHLVGYQG